LSYWDERSIPGFVDGAMADELINGYAGEINHQVSQLFKDAKGENHLKDSTGNEINGQVLDSFCAIGNLIVEYFKKKGGTINSVYWARIIFATMTPSKFAPSSPLFEDMKVFLSTESGQKLYDMCLRIVLRYYGMDWDRKMKSYTLNGTPYPGGDHNLRVSRMLESLRLMSEFDPKYKNVRQQLHFMLKDNRNVDTKSLGFWNAEMSRKC
jgi:hypothetical protein